MSKRSWIKLIVTITVLAIIALLVYTRFYPGGQWGLGGVDSILNVTGENVTRS